MRRYFVIIHPLKDRIRNKNRTTFLALVLIWFCSTAFALPFAIGTKIEVSPLHVKESGQVTVQDITFLDLKMDLDKFKIYYMCLFVGLHVVPFVSLVIMYVRIAWKLWHPDRRLTEQPGGVGENETALRISERNRRKTTIMVIAVLIAFFVCFFPFHIYFITQLFKDDYEAKATTETSVLRVILLLNAAINPFIYNLLSENFRAGFRALFACCLPVKTESRVGGASMDTLQSVGNQSL